MTRPGFAAGPVRYCEPRDEAMKKPLREARDRAILALRGAPSRVVSGYREALVQAGIDELVVDAYGISGLASLAPYEHRRLLAAAAVHQFSPQPRPSVDRAANLRPRLILHVGAVKTGSTATQLAMHHDRSRLWENGILYPPSIGFFGTRNYDSHNGIVAPLARSSASGDATLLAFSRYTAGLAAGADITVVSSERLYGAIDGDATSVGPDSWGRSYWSRRRRFLAKVAKLFADFEVEPVLWLRSPDALAHSLIGRS